VNGYLVGVFEPPAPSPADFGPTPARARRPNGRVLKRLPPISEILKPLFGLWMFIVVLPMMMTGKPILLFTGVTLASLTVLIMLGLLVLYLERKRTKARKRKALCIECGYPRGRLRSEDPCSECGAASWKAW